MRTLPSMAELKRQPKEASILSRGELEERLLRITGHKEPATILEEARWWADSRNGTDEARYAIAAMQLRFPPQRHAKRMAFKAAYTSYMHYVVAVGFDCDMPAREVTEALVQVATQVCVEEEPETNWLEVSSVSAFARETLAEAELLAAQSTLLHRVEPPISGEQFVARLQHLFAMRVVARNTELADRVHRSMVDLARVSWPTC